MTRSVKESASFDLASQRRGWIFDLCGVNQVLD
jgi:hypothetical protein